VDRLLAIYGSPREGGNSDTLMDYFIESAAGLHYEIERVYLRDLNILPCTDCGGCDRTGVCILGDDMVGLYDKLLRYGRIVMAFPVFFLGPPSIVKAFIDRVQALWVKKYVLGAGQDADGSRKGFLLSVCGNKEPGNIFSCNIAIVKAFYSACGFRYSGALLYPGIDGPHDVRGREDIKRDTLHAGGEFFR